MSTSLQDQCDKSMSMNVGSSIERLENVDHAGESITSNLIHTCSNLYTVPMDVDANIPVSGSNPTRQPSSDAAHEKRTFIRIIPHPHDKSSQPKDIFLEGSWPDEPDPGKHQTAANCPPKPISKPWAPFRNRADFEFAESVVVPNLSKDWVNVQLRGINGGWSKDGTNITFKSYDHMEKSLAAARKFVVQVSNLFITSRSGLKLPFQFQTGEVDAIYEGETFVFKFPYRDPVKWFSDIVTDQSLAPHSNWYPVQKYLHQNRKLTRLIDEPNTADKWWKNQDCLPQLDGLPHVFLPIVLWLDKGMVTKRVRKHPIILRAGWLPSSIRNASGNGGGVLIGYMPIVSNFCASYNFFLYNFHIARRPCRSCRPKCCTNT